MVPGHLKNSSLKNFKNYRFWLILSVRFKTATNYRLSDIIKQFMFSNSIRISCMTSLIKNRFASF
jgi:hypothetical protein